VGQKVSPVGLRIGINRDWESRWYAEKDFADLLHEDIKIRKYLQDYYKNAAVSKIEIERSKNRVKITIHTAKPGMVIGREGSVKDVAVKYLEKTTGKAIYISIVEIRRPELDAYLVARNIAEQLENRASFRKAQRSAISRTLKAGAKGVKTLVSGRLGGAEMARSEGYNEGNVPLHTLRADIDYAWAEALTTYGKLGVKVWIYKGDILPNKNLDEAQKQPKQYERNNDRNDRNNYRNDRNNNRQGGQGGQGGQRPYNNNNNRPGGQGGQGGQRPYNNNNNRPGGQGGQRPYNNNNNTNQNFVKKEGK
jgi:small subunit ribosomal protein S3